MVPPILGHRTMTPRVPLVMLKYLLPKPGNGSKRISSISSTMQTPRSKYIGFSWPRYNQAYFVDLVNNANPSF
jgi:hypothetical protein